MVGIVIVSHSYMIAEGIKELAKEMAKNVSIASAGGTIDGRLGTDADKIIKAIDEVYSDDGVIIIFDLGSALMNAEVALESIDENKRKNILITDTAMVEGAIIASIGSSINKTLSEIAEDLKDLKLGKMGVW